MSLVTAINPLTGVKAKASRDGAKHAARDALAALVIEDAAFQGNPDASDFVGEANAFLGAARVHRLRARRLRKKATKAAAMGAANLAQEISLAAEDEQQEAERLEGSLIRAVRESHQGVMGYVSPEEQKLLNWYAYKDKTSSATLGKQFEALSHKMIESAYNFGADGDEDEEVPLLGADDIYTAADVLGGDFEAVYGAFAFDDCYGLFKASKSKLRARLKRKRSRLRSIEKKLGALEDAGKSGLKVKFFQMRIQQLEKAIKRIKKKIGKTAKTKKKVQEADLDAEVQQAADTEVRKETAQPSLADLDAQEEAEEAQWLSEADGEIFGEALDEDLFAACDVYGMSERRASRIQRRVARLKARLPHVTRERRRARIERRIDRLESKLESAGMTTEPDEAAESDAYINVQSMMQPSTDAGDSYITNYGYPQTRADPSLYFQVGGMFGDDSIQERQPYLGFFLRRAAHYGVAVPNGQGDQFGGFWDGIKNFFSNLGQGTAKVAKATGAGIAKGAQATGQAVRTQWDAAAAARAAASTHGPAVRSARSDLRSQQDTLRQQRQAIKEAQGPGIRAQKREIRKEKRELKALQAQQAAALRQARKQAAPGISQSKKSLRKAKRTQRKDARAARRATIAARKAERRGGGGGSTGISLPPLDAGGLSSAGPTMNMRDFEFARSRAVSGAGGWSYLQQPDGTIQITTAPSEYADRAGLVLTSGPAWAAITAEIGPYTSSTATVGYDHFGYDEIGALEAEIDSLQEESWGW